MIVNTNQINVDVAQLWNYNQFICILRATPVLVSLYKCIKKWKKKVCRLQKRYTIICNEPESLSAIKSAMSPWKCTIFCTLSIFDDANAFNSKPIEIESKSGACNKRISILCRFFNAHDCGYIFFQSRPNKKESSKKNFTWRKNFTSFFFN